MSKPTSNLDWGGTKNEPSSGAKSAGYATGDRPTAQNLNWIFGNVDEWLKWQTAQLDRLAVKPDLDAVLNLRPTLVEFDALAFAATEQILVAVGGFGKIFTSTDLGATWAEQTPDASFSSAFLAALLYNSSLLVIAGDSGEIQTSGDGGNTWTHRTSGLSTTISSMASRGTALVVVGADGANARSSNGTAYTAGSALVGAGFNIQTVAASQTGTASFVCAGQGGGADRSNYVHRSIDNGATWSPVDLSSVLASGEYVEQLQWHSSVGFFALVRDSGASDAITCIIASSDGSTWSKVGSESLGGWGIEGTSYLRATPNCLVLIADDPFWQTLYSSDGGVTWSELPCGPELAGSDAPNSCAFLQLRGANILLAMGGDATTLYASPVWVY